MVGWLQLQVRSLNSANIRIVWGNSRWRCEHVPLPPEASIESTSPKRVAPAALAVIMLLVSTIGIGTPASAQTTITVSSTADPSASGLCTLHDAINIAQGGLASSGDSCASSGSGTPYAIVFSVTGTIGLGSILPTITSSGLTITGPTGGIAIDGENLVQVMQVASGAVISLSALTIEDGTSMTPTDPTGIPGGAIVNGGTLTLTNCTLSDNNAGSYAGAILNQGGTLAVNNTSFNSNSANGGAAGGAILQFERHGYDHQ